MAHSISIPLHSQGALSSCRFFVGDIIDTIYIFCQSISPEIVFLYMIFEQKNGVKIHLPALLAVSLITIFIKESQEFLLPAGSMEVHASPQLSMTSLYIGFH